ncbi:hypothetical protein D3C76_1157140 [compost metagenome]
MASQTVVIVCCTTAGPYSLSAESSGDWVSMMRVSPRVRPALRISLIASAVLSNDNGTQYSATTSTIRLPGSFCCTRRFRKNSVFSSTWMATGWFLTNSFFNTFVQSKARRRNCCGSNWLTAESSTHA